MESTSSYMKTIEQIIRNRATTKILGNPEKILKSADTKKMDRMLHSMTSIAGQAPFHYPADTEHLNSEKDSIVPWRFYTIASDEKNRLLQKLSEKQDKALDPKWKKAWNSKIPRLIAGADAIILVTWLPDSHKDFEKKIARDLEHVAAASSACQNLLLLAESNDLFSYWSSGGIFKDPECLSMLSISTKQKLLAAIFLSEKTKIGVTKNEGAWREKRGTANCWTQEIKI